MSKQQEQTRISDKLYMLIVAREFFGAYSINTPDPRVQCATTEALEQLDDSNVKEKIEAIESNPKLKAAWDQANAEGSFFFTQHDLSDQDIEALMDVYEEESKLVRKASEQSDYALVDLTRSVIKGWHGEGVQAAKRTMRKSGYRNAAFIIG